MIRENEIYKIGTFNKPHGVHGELIFTFTDDIFDKVDCDYIICPIDGIFVPFFIDEYRFKSDTTALFLLDGIDSVEKARMFTNTDVYFPIKHLGKKNDDDVVSYQYFMGFTVYDIHRGLLGVIRYIDDSTANVLFIVEDAAKDELYLPAHSELITDIDHKNRKVTFDLPDGLLTINHEERE